MAVDISTIVSYILLLIPPKVCVFIDITILNCLATFIPCFVLFLGFAFGGHSWARLCWLCWFYSMASMEKS